VNFRLLLCLALGVFTTYLGIVMLVGTLRHRPPVTPPPKPNFSAKETTVVDAETGERTIYREITVTTKLAPGPATPPPEKLHLGEPANGGELKNQPSF
jgi:hypothetical protein